MGFPIDQSAVPAGVGLNEEACHQGSGLRVANLSVILRTDFALASGAAAAIGGVAGADVLAWTQVPWASYSGRFSIPQTPTMLVTQVAAAANQVRFRVRGLDQFHSPAYELTPWVILDATVVNTAIPISRVFSWVSSVEYQSQGVIDTSTIAMGVSNLFDPTNAADPTNNAAGAVQVVNAVNLGIGTPLRISPYGVSSPVAHPEILGTIVGWNYRQSEYAHIIPFSGTTTGFTVGKSAAGFQGCPHKVGFDSHDNWVTQKIPGGAGDFEVGGQVEGVASSPPRHSDTLAFSLFLRSALGTRREANPESAYPNG